VADLNFTNYGGIVWEYLGGPVLRAGLLTGTVVYVYGASDFLRLVRECLPFLSLMGDPRISVTLEAYGLKSLIPVLVLIVLLLPSTRSIGRPLWWPTFCHLRTLGPQNTLSARTCPRTSSRQSQGMGVMRLVSKR
jgi:hypothetical protein